MRVSKILFLLFFSTIIISCGDAVRTKDYKSPDEEYGELFEKVQLSTIFPDSKTFVDCVPKTSSKEIIDTYEKQKDTPGFDLKAFVYEKFEVPQTNSKDFESNPNLTIEEHIKELWPILTREPKADGGSLIPLRKPYVVPGGRFREVYYWDSYFTMLGLAQSGKDTLIENMIVNFAQLIQDFGHVPNGNRSYYLSRSQPPFFASMVELLAKTRNDEQVLVKFLPQLQKEYQYWMSAIDREEAAKQEELKAKGELAFKKVVFVEKDNLLNRYCDESDKPRPEAYKEDVATAKRSGREIKTVYNHLRSGAESGWDYSSRWLADGKTLETIHTTDIVPVDLNALLYQLESTLERAYRLKGESYYADNFKILMEKRKAALTKFCWDSESGFFMDYDFVKKEKTKILSLAAVYPLAFKMASQEQADGVAKVLKEQFLRPGGLPSTLNDIGQQWDAPNGWAPLQWLAIEGLRNYGHKELAEEIKTRWISNNKRVFQNTRKLVEKYNVNDLSLLAGGGEYPVQDGFGWTNGVLLQLLSEK
ncbi:alpha,alpha-trehalase [Spirosomataceae bacterium TFI 002]|nr:alpha,alpha-trehalase [Spirosomataceae bacterium TFI 002]